MDVIELSRLLENLIRLGTILAVDHAARRCRVKSGRLETEWLRWMEYRAGETTTWNPPTVGEQCVILSPSGVVENGIVIYGAPSDVIDTPSHSPNDHVTKFPDGTVIRYDHAAGIHEALYPDGAAIRYNHHSSHLEATGIITGLVQATTSITLDTPLTHITGKCVIDDLLTYKNGMAGSGGGDGNDSVITGNFRHRNGTHEQTNVDQVGTGGSIVSNGIVLDSHHHVDPAAGDPT
ncbi:phage baseplate assembly protein V [Dechloromonas denitrificans]|uniref:phage baseplate assembly protein V n=1 Tax=Dechloromonas denitrificans TaxID=281362 RepID=UPI001CF8CE06|nr:phage baseplate assembly protein V [Dechloromonas denitrificans]UCV02302.1 phage baseplate assembly protein V [Dechloromonas denitrificans]